MSNSNKPVPTGLVKELAGRLTNLPAKKGKKRRPGGLTNLPTQAGVKRPAASGLTNLPVANRPKGRAGMTNY